MLCWLIPLSVLMTFVQFAVIQQGECSEDGLQWITPKLSQHIALYPLGVLLSLSCTAALRIIFIKSRAS
jgi:hypothetical protein